MNEKNISSIRFEEFKKLYDENGGDSNLENPYAWEQRKLGELMDVTSVKRIHQSDWTDSGIRFLRARDIVSASKNEEPADYLYISEDKYNEYSKISGKVSEGDLLVTGVGSIGVPMLITDDTHLYFKDGNIIWFKNEHKIEGNFFYYSFINNKIQKYIRDVAGIGTVGTYTIDSGKKTPIELPSYEEQAKIGEFFKHVDKTITLQQREYEKTVNFKKAMLGKLFPKEGEKNPEIRFEEFKKLYDENGGDSNPENPYAWEQRKFADVIDFSVSNNTLSRAGLNYDDSEVKNIHYGDILVKFDSIVDINSEIVPYVTDGKVEDFKNQLLRNGDVILADTAEDETTGKAVEVTGISDDSPAVSGLHTMIGRPNIDFAPKYLGYYLNSPSYRKQLLKLMQGIKVLSLSKSNVAETEVSFPKNITEQQQIGSFLDAVDTTITLQQCKPFFCVN